ncbi:hypothetical protein [Kocuria rhizosphaericola]|uniref:hypothetical protein n=1 Tax=Kocuria rhizosphaericola TaxID=3376284 RepID=UPI0037A6C7C9
MTTQVNDAAVSARETSRTTDALSTVEAASPLVFADWLATYRDELADVLFSEKRLRSAEYSQGFHTSVRARRDAFAQL